MWIWWYIVVSPRVVFVIYSYAIGPSRFNFRYDTAFRGQTALKIDSSSSMYYVRSLPNMNQYGTLKIIQDYDTGATNDYTQFHGVMSCEDYSSLRYKCMIQNNFNMMRSFLHRIHETYYQMITNVEGLFLEKCNNNLRHAGMKKELPVYYALISTPNTQSTLWNISCNITEFGVGKQTITWYKSVEDLPKGVVFISTQTTKKKMVS